MIAPRYVPLVLKYVARHRLRSLLTVAGVGTAVSLFVAIEALQKGVTAATHTSAAETTVVVYRKGRFCPFTSILPEYYRPQIEAIRGVASAIPMKVVVNNCRASLDVVTFRGVPSDCGIDRLVPAFQLVEGSASDWQRRSDAALLGETLAQRRRLHRGDRFTAAGVTVYVAGVFRSAEPQGQNVAYVHLDFLQQSSDRRLGSVTQFNVKVDAPAQTEAVAAEIDALFRNAEHPTTTRPERAFVAQVAADMIALVRFARLLGWGCLAAVLALVCNAIVLSVQGRLKDHAILQTLGYNSDLIGRLIVAEGLVLGFLGGGLGTIVAAAVVRWTRFSLSVDGLSIPIQADWRLVVTGLVASVSLGVLAGLVPAWQASRQEIATCFRAE